MTNHTPAPWTAERDPCHFDTLSTVTAGRNGRMVVQVGGVLASGFVEQEANTRLIAAAPDLLAALMAAHNELHECTAVLSAGDCAKVAAVMTTARAAIAKAAA